MTYLTGWVRIECRCPGIGISTPMSAPLHAALTPDQRQALLDLRHDPDLRPRVRLRVEALLLSAGGLKVPQLAAHLDCCEATVRTLLHRFAAQGLAAVHPQPTGFPPDLARRQRIEAVPDRLLDQPQAWTVTTLSEALAAEADIQPQAAHCVPVPEAYGGPTWRRTHASVRHRQARRALAERGIWLWYLPAYSPELNDIERTFTATETLTAAVETAFRQINTQTPSD